MTPAAKVTVERLGPLTTLLIQVATASLILLLAQRRRRTPRRVSLATFTLLALLEPLIAYGALNLALERTQALNAAFLDGLQSLMIVVLGTFVLRERVGRWQGVAIAMASVGTALVVSVHPTLDSISGDAMVLFGGLAGASAVVLVGAICRDSDPLEICTFQFGLGTLMILPITLWSWTSGLEQPPTSQDLPIVGAAMLLGALEFAIAYLLYYHAVERTSVVTAGISLTMIPLFGAALAVLWLRETFSSVQWAGAAVIVISLLLYTISSPSDPSPPLIVPPRRDVIQGQPSGGTMPGDRPLASATSHENAPSAPTPVLLMDLGRVATNYAELHRLFPDVAIHYAVKANSHPEVIRVLVERGCRFDVASPKEIDICLNAGASPLDLSYGHTIKKDADVDYAFQRGVRLFAVDDAGHLASLARHAPGSGILVRVVVPNEGAQWPLGSKFGCTAERAARLLLVAEDLGLIPLGVSFHVGSQQRNPRRWDDGIALAAGLARTLHDGGLTMSVLNLGGGLPTAYDLDVPDLEQFARAIAGSIREHFGEDHPIPAPRLMIEPGRGLVASAGILRTEVVAVIERDEPQGPTRWVYLDVGRFNGLAETEGEAIRYPLIAHRDGVRLTGPTTACVLAGPSCDSVDVLYRERPRQLPCDLRARDMIDLLHAGAYTSEYAAPAFNGMPGPRVICTVQSPEPQSGATAWSV